MRKWKLWVSLMLATSVISTSLCGCSKLTEKVVKSETVESIEEEDTNNKAETESTNETEEVKEDNEDLEVDFGDLNDATATKESDTLDILKDETESETENETENETVPRSDKITVKDLDNMSDDAVWNLLRLSKSTGSLAQWGGYLAIVPSDFYYFMHVNEDSVTPMYLDMFVTLDKEQVNPDESVGLVIAVVDMGESVGNAMSKEGTDTHAILEQMADALGGSMLSTVGMSTSMTGLDTDIKEVGDREWLLMSGVSEGTQIDMGYSIEGRYLDMVLVANMSDKDYDVDSVLNTVMSDMMVTGNSSSIKPFIDNFDEEALDALTTGDIDDEEDDDIRETEVETKESIERKNTGKQIDYNNQDAVIPSANNMCFTFNGEKVIVGKTTFGELKHIMGEEPVLTYDGSLLKFYTFGNSDTNEVEVTLEGTSDNAVIEEISISYSDYVDNVYSIKEFNNKVKVEDITYAVGKPISDESGIATWSVNKGTAEFYVFYDEDTGFINYAAMESTLD